MTQSTPARLRNVWWTVHRWIGVGFCTLLVPIALSGALLVWHDAVDALINPARYAVTGPQATQTAETYLARAKAALDPALRPINLRFPDSAGAPVRVQARGGRGNGPQRLVTVYLDPPTARVLDVVDFRSSFFGLVHRFHENLTIPQLSGRAVVGWAGVGMVILSLTGIWLWWPRNGGFLAGLRWRRAPMTITNLHHLIGFWIAVPLALVSLTGVYLSFPQNARSLMATIAPMGPSARSAFAGEPARETQSDADAALAAALAKDASAQPLVVFMPIVLTAGQGRRGGGARDQDVARAASASPIWRIQLRSTRTHDAQTVLVDDRTREVRALPDPLTGDRASQWIRWIHEGSHSGMLWQVIVFLTGIAPTLFALTGVLMWIRGRRRRKAILAGESGYGGRLQAAE